MRIQFHYGLERLHSGRAGGALLIALILVTFVAGMGAILLQSTLSNSRSTAVKIDARRAFYAAEAGLSEAMMSIAQGKSGAIGTAEDPAGFAGGVFWVESEEDEGLVTLRSTGLAGVGRRCLSVTVRRTVNPITSLGFFSGADLIVRQGGLVDGYDSSLGDFASQVDSSLPGETTGQGAQMGANGSVLLEALPNGPAGEAGLDPVTTIYGDVSPGPDGSLVMDPGVYVSGGTIPASGTAPMPAIEVAKIASQGSPQIGRGLEINGQDVAFDELNIPTGGIVRITGPATVVAANIKVHAGAALQLDTSAGPVVLHCLDNLIFDEGSSFGQVGSPLSPALLLISTNIDKRAEALAIQEQIESERLQSSGSGAFSSTGTGSAEIHYPTADLSKPAVVRFDARGTFHGVIYAPQAPLSLPSGMRVFGSVVASGLTLEDGARLTFDRALMSSAVAASALPRLISWRVVELPDVPLVRSRIDPIIRLRAAGITPEPATHRYREESIAIDYLDAHGMLNSYSGLYADFDSSRVRQVLGLWWYDADAGETPPAQLPPPPNRRTGEANDSETIAEFLQYENLSADELAAMEAAESARMDAYQTWLDDHHGRGHGGGNNNQGHGSSSHGGSH